MYVSQAAVSISEDEDSESEYSDLSSELDTEPEEVCLSDSVPDVIVLCCQEREGEDEGGEGEGEGEERGEDSAQDSEEERGKVQLAKSWLEAEETDTSDEEVCGK